MNPAPARGESPRAWKWRHLLLAPHRLGFLLAMVVLLVAALLWAGLMTVWGVRYGSWYGRQRAYSRAG